ncbi:39S ribosomal protein L27, mitochondrial [Fopius arisanus]|uniref:Large ribosomal subunit protein bL27m n=1 Tax=Fopius arisanus TaxID=64838 RepID=A0A9R1U7J8_9HYME|nr:PREDICTED: 39S ribosomal protein L27, mitochondrial [Fopius arisanus]
MSTITRFLISNGKSNLLRTPTQQIVSVRNAAKKTGTTTQNRGGNCRRPKHRGWKVQDGHYVQAGHILATQLRPRFHPGLHVGFGRNGSLFAMEAGKVVVTCEKVDLNWDHSWNQMNYSGRETQTIYKKHFNIIPEKQHDRFKLVDTI